MPESAILIVTGPTGAGKSTVSRGVAASLEASVHLRIDDFARLGVNGWLDPWLPEAAHQNRVVGGAVLSAAMEFARGGYTVVLDGCVFPDALAELTQAFRHRSMPLHYVILRCDPATCWERAVRRDPVEHVERSLFAQQHAHFDAPGERDRHVVDARGPADEVTAAVLAMFRSGSLSA